MIVKVVLKSGKTATFGVPTAPETGARMGFEFAHYSRKTGCANNRGSPPTELFAHGRPNGALDSRTICPSVPKPTNSAGGILSGRNPPVALPEKIQALREALAEVANRYAVACDICLPGEQAKYRIEDQIRATHTYGPPQTRQYRLGGKTLAHTAAAISEGGLRDGQAKARRRDLFGEMDALRAEWGPHFTAKRELKTHRKLLSKDLERIEKALSKERKNGST